MSCTVFVKGMNKNVIISFDGGMSYIRIFKSHVLKTVNLLSVQSYLKCTGKKDSGMDFNKHKCVFFPKVAWFLEMS